MIGSTFQKLEIIEIKNNEIPGQRSKLVLTCESVYSVDKVLV